MPSKAVSSDRVKRSKKSRAQWIKEQTVKVENGKISEYRVAMLVTFVLKD